MINSVIMPSVEKCCYFIDVDLGCILIGIASFLFSGLMLCISTLLLTTESHKLTASVGLPDVALRIIVSIAMVMSACNMAAAMLLIIGVIKSKPGFLLFFFSMGIFSTIMSQLSALLVLLAWHWIAALVILIVSMIYIHFLVIVHTLYDAMQRKVTDDNNPYDQLEETLIDE